MNWRRKVQLRIRALFQKRKLDAEMRPHIEMQTQGNIDAGPNPEEARYAALRQFGWAESIKETCRERRGVIWIEHVSASGIAATPANPEAPKAPIIPARPRYVFSVFAGQANGARTLVRRKIGWRRGLEISKRGSALPSFLRDKSRAPGEFSVGALNRYQPSGLGNRTGEAQSAESAFHMNPRHNARGIQSHALAATAGMLLGNSV